MTNWHGLVDGQKRNSFCPSFFALKIKSIRTFYYEFKTWHETCNSKYRSIKKYRENKKEKGE